MSEENKTSFVLHLDMLEDVHEMTVEEKADFLDFLVNYNLGTISLDDIPAGATKRYYRLFANQFDRDHHKWVESKEKRKEAGRKGGLAKVSKAKQCHEIPSNAKHKGKGKGKVEGDVEVKENVNSLNTLVDLAEPKQTQPLCPYKEIVDAYNRTLGHALPQCKVKTPARLAAMKRIWIFLDRDMFKIQSFFDKVNESDFLTGRGKSGNAFCGFDWLMKQNNCTKTIEGNYDNA